MTRGLGNEESTMNEKPIQSIHWSFWLIGVVALLWNVMGVVNYLMQTNAEALSTYPVAVQALVESRPTWATGAFAVAVFGGSFGCFLLLYKNSAAYHLFVVSLVGVVVTNVHTFHAGGSAEIWIGSLNSLVVGAFLIWYSRQVRFAGTIK